MGEDVASRVKVRCHAGHWSHVLRDPACAQQDEVVKAGEHTPSRLVDDCGHSDAVLGNGLERGHKLQRGRSVQA